LEGCRFVLWGDINADELLEFLARQREKFAGQRKHGFGLATSNHYISAAKGFTRWLARTRPPRAPSDPLVGLDKLNASTDVRIERRTLPPEEFAALLAAAREGTPFRLLTGTDREVLYTLAAYTGLRASELASLKPESFVLAVRPPSVMVEAPTA